MASVIKDAAVTVARVRESGKDPGQKATESSQISEIIEEVINLVEENPR